MSLAHCLDQGTRMSPNFFEEDPIGVLTSPTPLNSISTKEGSYRDVFTGKPNVFLFDNDFCDNAVDPDLYLNHACKQSADSSLNNVDQHAAISPPSDPLFPDLPPAINDTPVYNRQQSLNLVMEVLGSCPLTDSNPAPLDVSYPLTPSPEINEDAPLREMLPSRERHFTESDCDLISSILADEPPRTRFYSADLVSVHSAHMYQHEAGPGQADTGHHTNVANEACTSQSNDDCPSLESLPSFVRDAVKNSQHLPMISEDSLDVPAMLNDFLESSSTVEETNQPSTACNEGSPPPSMVDLTRSDSPPAKMVRTPSYKRKRDQNNKACRESRKKRKMKQSEAEERVKELTRENDDLRSQIARLEKETKVFNDLLVARISANMKK